MTIGLLGGLSWESSAEYYRILNRRVQRHLGGTHSARILLYSFDFAEVERLQLSGRWPELGRLLAHHAALLENAGAEVLVLATSTLHRVADSITGAVGVPFIHIADATAEAVRNSGSRRVGVLGTRYTMDDDLYLRRLTACGLEVILPDKPDRELVDRVIFEELVRGLFEEESRQEYATVIDRLHERGAEAVILACTEIGLLLRQSDTDLRLYDATSIHAEVAADFALGIRGLPVHDS